MTKTSPKYAYVGVGDKMFSAWTVFYARDEKTPTHVNIPRSASTGYITYTVDAALGQLIDVLKKVDRNDERMWDGQCADAIRRTLMRQSRENLDGRAHPRDKQRDTRPTEGTHHVMANLHKSLERRALVSKTPMRIPAPTVASQPSPLRRGTVLGSIPGLHYT